MQECKWCKEQHKKLGKSHIIPEAFINYDQRNDRLLISQDDYKKRRPVGSYDQNILCQKCERDFSYIDSRAAEILLKKFNSFIVPFADRKDRLAVQINGAHLHNIKEFLMYTLWKASVSTLNEFRGVNLGLYENRIKDQIINNAPLSIHCYSFIAFKIEKPLGNILPYRKKYDECNYYSLELGNYIFDVKVDNRITPMPARLLAEHENIVFITKDTTPDNRRQAMVDVIKNNEKNFTRKS